VDPDTRLQASIDSIAQAFAPDKRIVWFRVQAKDGVVKGETTSPAAKAALIEKLAASGITYIDSITILPSANLKGMTQAVVTISLGNLRVQPSHRAELATQATMGTPLKVWKQERGWYLVQTPDNYLAWIDGDAIQRMNHLRLAEWKAAPKVIFTAPYGFAYQYPGDEATISDMVYGDIMMAVDSLAGYLKVEFPDGRIAYIDHKQAMPYGEWRASRQPLPQNIVETAHKLMGIPYLWGGTSFKGVDCSGFTKTVYFMNGLVLPRDASQQVLLGQEIDTSAYFARLQPGDLLFFGGRDKTNLQERVVHVGLYIGNGEFIHSSGRVQVGSLFPGAPNYDAFEHRRLLQARRITPEQSLYDLRTTPLF
jgi:cell wall-associated NlpC family hydrolase